MATIERDVSLLQRRRVAPIYIVYGSAVQIRLNMIDYTIPTNATVEFFAQCGSGPVYRCGGTASGNSAAFTPPEGFFRQGDNALQLEINGRMIPLAIDVKCEERISGVGSEETPEQVRPLVLQAQDAAQEASSAATRAAGSASEAAGSASAAAGSADAAGKSAANALQSKNAAASSASSAAGSATAAGQSANAAAGSASAALGSQNAAAGSAQEAKVSKNAAANSAEAAAGSASSAAGSASAAAGSAREALESKNAAAGSAQAAREAMEKTQSISVKPAYIGDNGNWFVWDITQDSYVDTGVKAQGPQGVPGTGNVSSVCGVRPGNDGNVALAATDVGARPNSWMPTATDVGALPSTGGTMTGPINMNGQPISGLNDPTGETQAARKGYVDASVRKAAPRNLLDNSDFWNPVNQRGQTSYSLSAWGGYCIDRWEGYAASGTVTIGSGGLTLSGNIFQPIASDVIARYNGKVLTLAVKIAGAIYCCSGEVNQTGAWNSSARLVTPYGYISFETENDNKMFVIIDSSTTPSVLEWAALYEGAYTAETLPEYQPKGYAAELAECQRYYYTIRSDGSGYAAYATGTMNDASSAYFPIVFPIPMRIAPTLSYSGSFRVYVNGDGRPITDMVNNAQSRYSSRITIGNISSGVLGQACELQSNSDAKAFIAFDANL